MSYPIQNFNEENIIDTTENFDALFEMQNLSNASIKPVKKSYFLVRLCFLN